MGQNGQRSPRSRAGHRYRRPEQAAPSARRQGQGTQLLVVCPTVDSGLGRARMARTAIMEIMRAGGGSAAG
jgi:hypothetical protein